MSLFLLNPAQNFFCFSINQPKIMILSLEHKSDYNLANVLNKRLLIKSSTIFGPM